MINTGLDPEFWSKVEEDGFGVNVLPEDPEALAAVIEGLMDDPEGCTRMGLRARQIAREQFDRPNTYRKIIRLADRLLERQAQE